MAKTPYFEQLKDPRWQKRRLETFTRDDFACQRCGDTESMLAVHHLYYQRGLAPWEYPDNALITLCERCHDLEGREGGLPFLLLDAFRQAGFEWEQIEHFVSCVLSTADGQLAGMERFTMPHAIASALTDRKVARIIMSLHEHTHEVAERCRKWGEEIGRRQAQASNDSNQD